MVTVALIVCALICSAQSLQRTKQTSFYIALPNSIQTGVSVFIQKHKGYVSYAMDIPGYGQSSNYFFDSTNWLIYVIQQILNSENDINKFVLITASMSGMYAMPLLIENQHDLNNNNNYLMGLIAVAPVSTDLYNKKQYESVSIPICIIYGENDYYIGIPAEKDLAQTPKNTIFMIPNADHACYEDNPSLFIKDVATYLQEIDSNVDDSLLSLHKTMEAKRLSLWIYIAIASVAFVLLYGICRFIYNK
eukprot:74307_1